jgi:hypothetical protein
MKMQNEGTGIYISADEGIGVAVSAHGTRGMPDGIGGALRREGIGGA